MRRESGMDMDKEHSRQREQFQGSEQGWIWWVQETARMPGWWGAWLRWGWWARMCCWDADWILGHSPIGHSRIWILFKSEGKSLEHFKEGCHMILQLSFCICLFCICDFSQSWIEAIFKKICLYWTCKHFFCNYFLNITIIYTGFTLY